MKSSSKMTYTFKVCNIHLFALVSFIILVPLTILISTGSFSTEISIVLFFSMIVLIYGAALMFFNKLLIYDDHIEIYFPFRIVFFKRFNTAIIHFDDVSSVKLISKNAKEPPTINFYCKTKNKIVYKSFPVYKFDNRKSILLFLRDKGLNIEIDSVSKRDNQILKNDIPYRMSSKY